MGVILSVDESLSVNNYASDDCMNDVDINGDSSACLDRLFLAAEKEASEPKEPPKLPSKIIIYLPGEEEEEGDQPLRKTEKETTGQWLINNTIDSITALALPSLLIATAYTLGKKAQIGAAGGYLGVLALTSVINLKSTRDRVEPYVLKGAYAVAKAVFSS